VSFTWTLLIDRLKREFKVEVIKVLLRWLIKSLLIGLLITERFTKSNQVVKVNLLISYLIVEPQDEDEKKVLNSLIRLKVVIFLKNLFHQSRKDSKMQ
jgi:hypothetical protein